MKKKEKAKNYETVPISSTSYENYSKNIMDEARSIKETNVMNQDIVNKKVINEEKINTSNDKDLGNKVNSPNNIKRFYNIGKEFMNLGMYMAEGKNYRNNYNDYDNKRNNISPVIDKNIQKENDKDNESRIVIKEIEDDENG